MTFPVIVHPANGKFEAALVGAPDVRATAGTRAEALAALESAIAKRLDQGELVALEIRRGLAGLFGKYRDDPTLREICETAYRERDADVHVVPHSIGTAQQLHKRAIRILGQQLITYAQLQ